MARTGLREALRDGGRVQRAVVLCDDRRCGAEARALPGLDPPAWQELPPDWRRPGGHGRDDLNRRSAGVYQRAPRRPFGRTAYCRVLSAAPVCGSCTL